MSLTQKSLDALAPVKSAYGETAFNDLLKIVTASPAFEKQVNDYVAANGSFAVGDIAGEAGHYAPGRDNPSSALGGKITLSSNPSYLTGATISWSLGYGIAQTLAHELGHAFDPGLSTDAISQASAQDANDPNKTTEVMLRTQSEAKAELNSLGLMTEARKNLPGVMNSSDGGGPLFDPYSQKTLFKPIETAVSAFMGSGAGSDLAQTCSTNAACLALVTKLMGQSPQGVNWGAGYYNYILSGLTGNVNQKFVAPSLLAQNDGGYEISLDSSDGSTINVVDSATKQVVQKIVAQTFDDGSALLAVTNRDGSSSNLSVDTTGSYKLSNLDSAGHAVSTDAVTYNSDGSKVEDLKFVNSDGSTLNDQKINTSASGAVRAEVSGQGAVLNIDSASIAIADGSSALIKGASNSVSAGTGTTVDLQGAANEFTGGPNGDITIESTGTGSATQVNTSNSQVNVKDGAAVQTQGDGNQVTLGANAQATVLGNANTVTATGSGDSVTVGGNGQSASDANDNHVNFAGGPGTLTVTDNARADATGNGVTTTIGNDVTMGLSGSADTVNATGQGDHVWTGGNGQNASDANDDHVYFSAGQVGSVTALDNSRVDVNGQGISFTAGNQDNVGMGGSGNTVNVVGQATNVWAGGNGQNADDADKDRVNFADGVSGSANLSDNSRVDVSGSGLTVNAGSSDSCGGDWQQRYGQCERARHGHLDRWQWRKCIRRQ